MINSRTAHFVLTLSPGHGLSPTIAIASAPKQLWLTRYSFPELII